MAALVEMALWTSQFQIQFRYTSEIPRALGMAVKGTFSFTFAEGTVISVDENGFQSTATFQYKIVNTSNLSILNSRRKRRSDRVVKVLDCYAMSG